MLVMSAIMDIFRIGSISRTRRRKYRENYAGDRNDVNGRLDEICGRMMRFRSSLTEASVEIRARQARRQELGFLRKAIYNLPNR
jgi:hypothetical protein